MLIGFVFWAGYDDCFGLAVNLVAFLNEPNMRHAYHKALFVKEGLTCAPVMLNERIDAT